MQSLNTAYLRPQLPADTRQFYPFSRRTASWVSKLPILPELQTSEFCRGSWEAAVHVTIEDVRAAELYDKENKIPMRDSVSPSTHLETLSDGVRQSFEERYIELMLKSSKCKNEEERLIVNMDFIHLKHRREDYDREERARRRRLEEVESEPVSSSEHCAMNTPPGSPAPYLNSLLIRFYQAPASPSPSTM